jgi:hypothetical protein
MLGSRQWWTLRTTQWQLGECRAGSSSSTRGRGLKLKDG